MTKLLESVEDYTLEYDEIKDGETNATIYCYSKYQSIISLLVCHDPENYDYQNENDSYYHFDGENTYEITYQDSTWYGAKVENSVIASVLEEPFMILKKYLDYENYQFTGDTADGKCYYVDSNIEITFVIERRKLTRVTVSFNDGNTVKTIILKRIGMTHQAVPSYTKAE